MENIFFEETSHAEINLLKNYSRIGLRTELAQKLSSDDSWGSLLEATRFKNDTYSLTLYDHSVNKDTWNGHISLKKLGNKNSVFFRSTEGKHIKLDFEIVRNPFKHKSAYKYNFETNKERHIKKYYNDPFANIAIYKTVRKIFKNGDKITINFFYGIRERRFNSKFFKSSYESKSLTINTKTGNITVTRITSGRSKVKTKKFFTNDFHNIYCLLNEVFEIKTNKWNQRLDDNMFFKKICETFGFNVENIDRKFAREFRMTVCQKLIDFFIKTKKISVPDFGYHFWFKEYYPKEKFLKKNNRKLISSILDMMGIKSKSLIKLLHEVKIEDLIVLKMVACVFGEDYHHWIGKINWQLYSEKEGLSHKEEDGFFKNFDHQRFIGQKQFYSNHTTFEPYSIDGLTTSEKKYILTIINDSIKYQKSFRDFSSLLSDMKDHFRMYRIIKAHYTDVRLSATTKRDFYIEHSEFSSLFSTLKKKTQVKLVFDERTIIKIEKEIIVNEDVKIQPIILKDEASYISEGSYMHHCVSSYVGKESSIIVSLREDNSGERVTCEVDVKTGRIVQARHFCNQPPPEQFNRAVEILKNRTIELSRYEGLKPKERLLIPNNTQISSLPVLNREFLF